MTNIENLADQPFSPDLPGTIPEKADFYSRFHVVLVEPQDSLNIGSVARCMGNLGFSQLHVVAPPNFSAKKAGKTACWSRELVEKIVLHDSLADAVKGIHDVVGFSARPSPNRPNQLILPQWSNEIRSSLPQSLALVFGSETEGLRQEHLELCRATIRIPSQCANPVFNLAQSVLIGLMEISRLTWDEAMPPFKAELPDWNDFYRLDQAIEQVATKTRYFRAGTPRPVPALMKSLVRRMQANKYEIRVLLGFFSRVAKTLAVLEKK